MEQTLERNAPNPAQAEILGGVVPYLNVDGAVKAAAFYEKAFGAKEVGRYPVDEKGRTMHLHLHLNNGSLMLCDFYPEHGHPFEKPQAFMLHLRVEGINDWWDRAIEAGCEAITPVQLMFWGDYYGQLRDPFGVSWAFTEPPKA